jgi:indole-3-glycerol phosphate synthase
VSALSVLEQIAKDVRVRLEQRKAMTPLAQLRERAEASRPRPFAEAFRRPGVHVIAELKRRSPSAGRLSRSPVSATELAADYLRHGAVGLSVLTEADHFDGALEALAEVRAAFPDARLLQKDFMLEPYQLFEARALGADAVLLIVALLGERGTHDLLKTARTLGLDALVEVHDEAELASARAIGAELIGINNRDLKTLKVDLGTATRLAPLASGATLVCESGLSSGEQVPALARAGFSAYLIGSAFMKTDSPGAALAKFLEEAR